MANATKATSVVSFSLVDPVRHAFGKPDNFVQFFMSASPFVSERPAPTADPVPHRRSDSTERSK
jgi:hypothetical protein